VLPIPRGAVGDRFTEITHDITCFVVRSIERVVEDDPQGWRKHRPMNHAMTQTRSAKSVPLAVSPVLVSIAGYFLRMKSQFWRFNRSLNCPRSSGSLPGRAQIRNNVAMNEIVEQLAREFATVDATRYLMDHGESIRSAAITDVIKNSMVGGWLSVCKEREVTGKEFARFNVSYYPCFATTYLKTIYGDDKDIRITANDRSDRMNN
jgi:hypothetical protein